MQATECPKNWDYEHHQNYKQLLPLRCYNVLKNLRLGKLDSNVAKETRGIHSVIFQNLTPDSFDYFAGNYRGSEHLCLKYYDVHVQADPRVGTKHLYVNYEIRDLQSVIDEGLNALDIADKLPITQIPEEDKVYYIVTFACRIFVEFLRIHPYANGNGHIARFIIWAILGRYGVWPKKWPMNDRPPDPPYSTLITEYRDGYKEGLETFVLKCALGE